MKSTETGSVLLVIDVQQGLFERSTPIYQAEQVLNNINFLVEKAHRENVPVIYIQHANDNTLKRGSHEWQFHDQIQPGKDDLHIHKLQGNAFENTPLQDELQAWNITQMIATGLLTNGCVQATCQGGLKLGFRVVLASDAHSTFGKTAPNIIKDWQSELAAAGVELIETNKIVF